jgi:thioester reductase-like protein
MAEPAMELADRLAGLSPAKRRLLLERLRAATATGTIAGPTPMEVRELAAAARLPTDVDPQRARERAPAVPAQVLLTGATGFFGAFLLDELLRASGARIHCLVRAPDLAAAGRRLRANLAAYGLDPGPWDRVEALPGDLGQPLLGLPAAVFDRLAATLDAIVHCGGAVKWTYPYAALAPANVAGTGEVLRLAAARRLKAVHHISTVGVFSSPARPEEPVREDEPLEDSGPLYVGYAQTKWVAEKLVWRAAERGLPVTVHRPNLGGHSVTGAFNHHDHLAQLIAGCVQLGVAPELTLRVAPAPVDWVSRGVIALAQREDSWGRAFHYVADPDTPWGELTGWLRGRGYRLETVPLPVWRQRLAAALAAGAGNALAGLSPFFFDALVDHARLPPFDHRTTRAHLRTAGVPDPPAGDELWEVYLRRFAAAGYLPPAGE